MSDSDKKTIELLRQKAALLLQRERSHNALRQKHEQVRAWLTALQVLSKELACVRGEEVIYSRAAQMLVQELHFRTALVISLSDEEIDPTIQAVKGHKTTVLKKGSLQFSQQSLNQLGTLSPGYCNSANEDTELAWLGRDLGLYRYLWCPTRISETETLVLIAGHDQSSAEMSPTMPEGELNYFVLLAQHVEALVRNARLVWDLQSERERLATLNVQLEERVSERTRALAEANASLLQNVEKLQNTQNQLMEMSRQAGMAEIASGVLHNLGNVLNSISVIAGMLRKHSRDNALQGLDRLNQLFDFHKNDWQNFLNHDPKGKRIPEFIHLLADHVRDESLRRSQQTAELEEHVQRARKVLAAQQSFAKLSSFLEEISVRELIEDALRLVDVPLRTAQVQINRNFLDNPVVISDRHHVLEILVNLLSNATDAMVETPLEQRWITLTLNRSKTGGAELLVQDNGSGIEESMISRIFSHGVTTKPQGHGFGLHISSLSARKLGASLQACSDGPGQGATFRLNLPVRSPGEFANSNTIPKSA